MTTTRKVCLLINPFAARGKALKLKPAAEAALTNLCIPFRTVISADINEARTAAYDAIQQGECVAVMGGDGSLRAVLDIIVENNGLLATIPAGRGNDFARMLNISRDVTSACQVIASGAERLVDVGVANGEMFLGICITGLDGEANHLANKVSIIKNQFVYVVCGLVALAKWRPKKFEVNIDGEKISHRGYSVAAANSKCYGGGLYLAPDANIQDGLLEAILMGYMPKLKLISKITNLYLAKLILDKAVLRKKFNIMTIATEEPEDVYADGDLIAKTPVKITVRKNCLRIIGLETNESGIA